MSVAARSRAAAAGALGAALRSSSTPTPLAPLFWGRAAASPWPMKTLIMAAASTGPPPWVLPRGLPPAVMSRSRMMDVSACEPQPLEEQSRGVPSTMDRPGISTPLAPVILVTVPWAEA